MGNTRHLIGLPKLIPFPQFSYPLDDSILVFSSFTKLERPPCETFLHITYLLSTLPSAHCTSGCYPSRDHQGSHNRLLGPLYISMDSKLNSVLHVHLERKEGETGVTLNLGNFYPTKDQNEAVDPSTLRFVSTRYPLPTYCLPNTLSSFPLGLLTSWDF